MGIDPMVDLLRIETNELPDLEERHSVLGGESSNETLGRAESFGERWYARDGPGERSPTHE